MQDLATTLKAIGDSYPFTTRWHVKDLRRGAEAHHEGDVRAPSASVRKTSILMAALAAVQAGKLTLDEKVEMEARLQKDVASGTWRYMTPGCVIPFRDVLVNMIITSDNVCTQAVLERLGPETMDPYCHSIGMTGTNHRGLIPPLGIGWDHPAEAVATTTQSDQVLLLDLILRGSEDTEVAKRLGCTPDLCRLALDILSWQILRNVIPSLLPWGTKVAHKTGRGRRGRMDAGIVYDEGRPLFILSAATDWVPETMPDGLPGFAASFASIGRIARACWDTLR
ncbi:serine hydrolase [Falsiroseomonas selenitidurans]|uniref:Serine hydrolase n=1 Tax=Falsiroseomonas selenitidurans TaxID=2716335 RepID=A0ABX1E230_9PROT|nr:serine hydrolase [Falsiroseomonas selenitidurans]NKC30765.1 serine hydrolase [Falsiroseomonas selenitidurans]